MGYILKLILFFIVLVFVFRKIASLVAMITGSKSHSQRARNNGQKEGEINIDYKPKNKSGRYGEGFEGGEYVDYEEVK